MTYVRPPLSLALRRTRAGNLRLRIGVVMAVLLLFAAGCNRSSEGDGAQGTTGGEAAPQVGVSLPDSVAAQSASQGPPASVAPDANSDPVVVLRTSQGDVFIRLHAGQAPRTVRNFMDYAIAGQYDGTIFHRVETGYAILGGTYDEKLRPKQVRYPIPNEATNGLKNKRGTLAMARSTDNPHSATTSFFINLVDNPKLDHRGTTPADFGYCVFGEIVDGLDVVDKIAAAETATVRGFEKMPVQTVLINDVRFMR